MLPQDPQSPASRDHCPAFAGFPSKALARTRIRWLWGSQAGSLRRQRTIGHLPKGKARRQVSEWPGLVPGTTWVSPAAVPYWTPPGPPLLDWTNNPSRRRLPREAAVGPAAPLWDMAGPLQAPCWIPRCGQQTARRPAILARQQGWGGRPGPRGPPSAEPGRWPWAPPGLTG